MPCSNAPCNSPKQTNSSTTSPQLSNLKAKSITSLPFLPLFPKTPIPKAPPYPPIHKATPPNRPINTHTSSVSPHPNISYPQKLYGNIHSFNHHTTETPSSLPIYIQKSKKDRLQARQMGRQKMRRHQRPN